MCIHELILTFMKTGLLCNCFAWFIKLNYTLNSENIAYACSLNVQIKPNSLVLHMFSGFQQTDAIFNILWWFGSVCQHRHPLGRAFVPTFKSPFICMVYVCMFFQPRKQKFVIIKLFIIQEGYSLFPFKYNLSNTNSRHKLLMSGLSEATRMFLEATKQHRLHILQQFISASVNDKETACSDHQKKYLYLSRYLHKGELKTRNSQLRNWLA